MTKWVFAFDKLSFFELLSRDLLCASNTVDILGDSQAGIRVERFHLVMVFMVFHWELMVVRWLWVHLPVEGESRKVQELVPAPIKLIVAFL